MTDPKTPHLDAVKTYIMPRDALGKDGIARRVAYLDEVRPAFKADVTEAVIQQLKEMATSIMADATSARAHVEWKECAKFWASAVFALIKEMKP